MLIVELFGEEHTTLVQTMDVQEEEMAAIKIQSAFRGMQARQTVKTMKEEVTTVRLAVLILILAMGVLSHDKGNSSSLLLRQGNGFIIEYTPWTS